MKILIVLNQGIGNIVMATPMIQALREMWLDIDLMTFCNFPGIEELFQDWQTIENIYTFMYGKLVDPSFNIDKYDKIVFGVWCDENLINHPIFGNKEKVFLTYKDFRVKHEIEWNMDLARMFGYRGPTPPLYIEVQKYIKNDNIYRIGMHPGCLSKFGWHKKRWPYFNKLITLLLEKYNDIEIHTFGGPEDGFYLNYMSERVHNWIGKLSLKETTEMMNKMDLFITNDSGLMHIAAALDLPVISLFGPTLPIKNMPVCSKYEILTSDISCSPCLYTPLFQNCKKNNCMRQISVNQVMEVVKRWKV